MRIEIHEVKKSFVDRQGKETVAVDGVSLRVEPGELVTLLGPSGCGKTTTLRMVAGFELPTSGTISIDGKNVSRLPPHRRDIGMVFQSYALFPHMSVRQNASFGLSARPKDPKGAERLAELAAMLELVPLLERAPHELSGGQQQRVALLRALVPGPKVLLLDEPLSNLDARLRAALRQELRQLQRRLGITTLNVTHDQEEAMSLSDRVVVMQGGRIAQQGAPAELYARPASRFVASFLGDATFVAGRVTGEAGERVIVDSLLGEVRLPRPASGAAQVTLVVRPEAVRLSPGGTAGRVMGASYLGPEVRYVVEVQGHTILARAPALGRPLLAEGAPVGLELLEEAVHLLAEV